MAVEVAEAAAGRRRWGTSAVKLVIEESRTEQMVNNNRWVGSSKRPFWCLLREIWSHSYVLNCMRSRIQRSRSPAADE